MNERILSEFGDILLSHRNEITAEWALAIQPGPGLGSPGYFGDTELVDHLPQLFHNLAASLKSPLSHEQRREFVRAARKHDKYRWPEGISSIKAFVRPASSGESLSERG